VKLVDRIGAGKWSLENSPYKWLYKQNMKEEGRIFPQIKLAKLVAYNSNT
jgi:hypothetical protein